MIRKSRAKRFGLALVVAVSGSLVGCGDGQLVTLGRTAPSVLERPRFLPPVPLDELAPVDAKDGYKDDNPVLTADLLEIYFTSTREGGPGDADVWRARRSTRDARFDPPEPVAIVSTSKFDSSPAVSFDGLTLWVGSEREGGLGALDIWVSRRTNRDAAWSEPELVSELSTSEKDIPRPPGQGGLVMPFASQRDSPGVYRTFLAKRERVDAAFSSVEPLSELWFDDRSTVDAFLTDDGLSLYVNLSTGDDDGGDLYVARRATLDEPFSAPEPITELNTSGDERDPWLSPDGTHFFFASDRDGALRIYQSEVVVVP